MSAFASVYFEDIISFAKKKKINFYISVTNTHNCYFFQIEKNEMDWTCSTYGGEKVCIQGFRGET